MSYSNYETNCAANYLFKDGLLYTICRSMNTDLYSSIIQWMKDYGIHTAIDKTADVIREVIINDVKQRVHLNACDLTTKLIEYSVNNIQYKEIANELVFNIVTLDDCQDEVIAICN